MWRSFFDSLSSRTRIGIGVVFVLLLASRATIVLASLQVKESDPRAAVLWGVAGSLCYVAQRAIGSALRVRIESELYTTVARVWLRADTLTLPSNDMPWGMLDANYGARSALTSTLPAIVADALTSVAVMPILLGLLPKHLLLLVLFAMTVLVGSTYALRRVIQRIEKRIHKVYGKALDTLFVAIEGRLELVAQAREDHCIATIDDAFRSYEQVAARSRVAAAALDRAPFVLALLVLGLGLDDASRDGLFEFVKTQALVLVACGTPWIALIFGISELARVRAQMDPLWRMLTLLPRPELGGEKRVALSSPVSAESVSFSYSDGQKETLTDLLFSWTGQCPLVLTGPNGCGKSTLLRLLVGLRSPSRGTFRIGAFDLGAVDVRFLREQVAFLPQRPYLGEPYHSIRDALRILVPHAEDAEMERALDRTAVLEALREHEGHPLDVRIGTLSAGQRQRVALARVVLQNAKLVLLDEPDVNLDRRGLALVVELVEELVANGTMVVIAAHTSELASMDALRVDLTRR